MHGWLSEVGRPIRPGDDDRGATVGHQAAVEQVQRFGDPPRGLVLFEGERLALLRKG
ncbi:hypothetical protein ACFQV8_19255 [Pseudonocardia benzenivorans]